MSDLVGNHEDWLSHAVAQTSIIVGIFLLMQNAGFLITLDIGLSLIKGNLTFPLV